MARKKAEKESIKKTKIDVQAATLVGTIRDNILDVFKNHGDWKKLPEGKQRDLADGVEHVAKEVIRKSANIIAGRGFKSMHGTLKAVNVKDGLKLTVEASKAVECRQDLIDAQGGGITIVLSDISPYTTERSEPDIDLDEPQLPIEGEK